MFSTNHAIKARLTSRFGRHFSVQSKKICGYECVVITWDVYGIPSLAVSLALRDFRVNKVYQNDLYQTVDAEMITTPAELRKQKSS